MSLSLSANTLAISPGLTSSFLAIGGTGPYSYSVAGGGVGGTINSSGFYTAPSQPSGVSFLNGFDTIIVTDALFATASLQILVAGPLFLFCDIIQNQLNLAAGSVYLWDQKINIPIDGGLYVAVSSLNQKAFGSSNSYNPTTGLVDTQSVNMQSDLQLDIFSRSTLARDRKEEIVMALDSVYAQQQMAMNSFSIGRLPSQFTNLSSVDGAAILYRYSITVRMQYFVTKTGSVPYYSSFPGASLVQTEP